MTNKIPTPRAKLGDTVKVNLFGRVGQIYEVTDLYISDVVCGLASFVFEVKYVPPYLSKEGVEHDVIHEFKILENLTTGERFD